LENLEIKNILQEYRIPIPIHCDLYGITESVKNKLRLNPVAIVENVSAAWLNIFFHGKFFDE
jgi:hypothetical protein